MRYAHGCLYISTCKGALNVCRAYSLLVCITERPCAGAGEDGDGGWGVFMFLVPEIFWENGF